MSIAGGIAGIFVEGKKAVRDSAVSKMLKNAANLSLPFITQASGELKQWGAEDWNHFKDTYRPVADALVADANKAPDYNRYEKEATLSSARGVGDANSQIMADASRTGAGPNSGRFAADTLRAASAGAANEGIGQAMGRQTADQVATGKKLAAIDMGRPDPSSSIAGLGAVVRGGADYGKYSAAIGRQATEAWGGVGKGFGEAIGSYKPKKTETYGMSGPGQSGNTFNSDSYSSSVDPAYADAGYADGGVIRGPGTGRSDSIPAVVDGQRPAAVSNGEYHIAADIVAKIGKPRLEALIAIAQG